MFILGINAYHADSSAAIFKDGRLLVATEEERFTRIKHWAGFPVKAIQFCLDEAGISMNEVEHICIGRNPWAKLDRKIAFVLSNPGDSWSLVQERLQNREKITSLEQEFDRHFGVNRRTLKARISYIEHHRSHLASAFFASPFEEAAILSIDGSGDFTTTMIAVGKGNQITVLDSLDFPQSMGLFYTAFTQFLGFEHYGDEYKIMGLAPYGQPNQVEQVRSLLELKPNGLFGWKSRYFVSPGRIKLRYTNHIPTVSRLYGPEFESLFGKPRRPDEALTQNHKDLAASVQKVCEETIFHILEHLAKKTGLKNLCIAGGVAQNSVANGKVLTNTPFEKLYIPSAGHDAGISMGAALYRYHHGLGKPRTAPIRSAYTGCRYSNEEIENLLISKQIPYSRLEDNQLFDKIVDVLVAPGVVGWFSGRAEFGPRALGARSILADPRNAEAKELLNLKIKRRESFRPFAPSILKEYAGEYFLNLEDVPFMEKVLPIRPSKQAEIPAVTHVDGSGRLQTVDALVSPRYHALIERFRQRTGTPILLNTSFNENEPIVNTPMEALDCFLRTKMDLLVLENCLVYRPN